MATTPRPVIGLLINQIEGRYQSQLRRGFSDFCRAQGLALRLFVGRSLASPYGSEDDENHVYGLARPGRRAERLDGLAVTAGSIGNFLPPEALQRFLASFAPLPLVTIGLRVPGYPGVACENGAGVTELVTHLVRDHGHRRLAFLAGPEQSADASARRAAFTAALRAAGLEPDPRLFLQGDFTFRCGEPLAAALDLRAGLPFDAVVAANDDMALGFLDAMARRGLTCPRDYALTGFDDLPDARFVSPALTTVHQPLYQQAVRAGELLLARLSGRTPEAEAPAGPLPSTPVVRRSCGCSEAPRIASRVHRAAEAGAAPAAPLREAVVTAAEELALPVRKREQAAEALSALAETILLDLRTFRDNPLFLQTLGEWFDLTAAWEDFAADWHRVLSLFHREVLRSIADARTRGHVDDLLQAGFTLLARKSGDRDLRELASLRGVMRVFRDLSGQLATVPDVDGLVRTVSELAPLVGLSRLELFLLRGGPVTLAGPDAGDPLAGEVLARPCLSGGGGDEQILMPLVNRRHVHGYVLMESADGDALVYDTVRDQLSQTLGALLLAEERGRAQEALRQSEERFRELATAAPMMVIETDAALNVTYINPAGREGLGLAEASDGLSLRPHLSGEDDALARDLIRRIGQLRVLNYPGVRLINRAGRRYVPVVQLSGIFDAAGALGGIRWNALDPLPLLASGMLPDPAFFAERKITGREREVIELLLQGFRIRDMADRLSIAESTVKGHLTQVYDKLGINGRAELLQLIQDEQVRRRGFSAYVFGLVSRLVSGDAEGEPEVAAEPARQR